MARASIPRRLGRVAKSIIFNEERSDMAKRLELSQKQVARRVRNKKKLIREEGYRLMMKETGMSQEALKDKFEYLRDLNIATLTFFLYRAYGLYRMTDDEAVEALRRMKEAEDLEDDLKWDFRQVDLGRKTYEELEEKSAEVIAVMKRLLTPEAKREIAGKAAYLQTQDMDDREIEDLAADMEFSRCILRFDHNEYAAFHFHDKSVPERRAFIGDAEKRKILKDINTEESIGILDDKLMSYERLKDYYGRDLVSIASEKDYLRFKRFFMDNDAAVIKPRFESLGKGISLIERADIKNMWKLFLELVDEHRRFLMEGYIHAAEEIKKFNPDSVNTVRVIAYHEGDETSIRSASMRIGHAGSFIDNLGAGGITVSVDKDTGEIISDGIDEMGVMYERHPDTGVKFKGTKLPAWDGALETVRAAAEIIDGAKYVGWDLACTSDYKWVIVEGNSKTGFFGAQAPIGTGRRAELFETIGKDPCDPLFCEVTYKMAEALSKEEGIPLEDTMKGLKHFESLGLDGRYYKSGRAWELTDEECVSRFGDR